MSYASVTQFITKWGDMAIKWSNQDTPSATVANNALIQTELDRATAIIDSYLVGRYAAYLPLANVPDDLVWRCLVIAAYNLARYPDDYLSERYQSCMSWLRDVSAGKASLSLEPVVNAPFVDAGIPSFATSEPIFSEENLRGY